MQLGDVCPLPVLRVECKRQTGEQHQKTTKDPEIKGSRIQQRSVTDHPPLSDCTKTQ